MLTLLLYRWLTGTGRMAFSDHVVIGFAIFDIIIAGIFFGEE